MRGQLSTIMIAAACMAAFALPPAVPSDHLGPVSLGRMTLGYSYYNRPGDDLVAHDADLLDCAAKAAPAKAFEEERRTPTIALGPRLSVTDLT
jgi:hypothetical protein